MTQTQEGTQKRNKPVPLQDFVGYWKDSKTYQELAEKTGGTLNSVKTRVSQLRKPEFKKDADGKIVLDANGQPVISRRAIPLDHLTSERSSTNAVEEALKMIAERDGVSLETIQERQREVEQEAVKALLAANQDD